MARSYQFLGIRVDNITMDEVIKRCTHAIQNNKKLRIATVNPELVMISQRNSAFKQTLNTANIVTPDGVGLILTGRLTSRHLEERVTGADLCVKLAEAAAQHNWQVYLLGAGPGVAQRAADNLCTQFPGLQIKADERDPNPGLADQIVGSIKNAKTDILLVAYGSPSQELWLAEHGAATGANVVVGVGGSFDFLAGAARRAPQWVQSIGLEWFWRLVLQPKRFKRMLVLPVFAIRALFERRA